ncbi:MAG: energy-coupling factor ABC transporter ATP-binding protein, partial [Candidatus Sumerlaeota bacterium]
PDGHPALEGIDFRITHGESVGIVGENGAGKSTLLLHLNGCLGDLDGSVRVGDDPLTKKTLRQTRRSVGFVFQNPDDQLFMPTVYDDVAFGPLNQGLPREEVDERVRRALETVDVAHLSDRPPYHLSVGEKRGAAIASVLSMWPDILVMDEPTAGLDPRTRRHLIELLRTFEHTKIIASHDMDMIIDLCDRVIVLHEGRVLKDGPAAEILADKALLEEAHLELPLRMQDCPVCGTPAR